MALLLRRIILKRSACVPCLAALFCRPCRMSAPVEAEAVIGYDLWQNRYAGDPAIVGKTIQINLHPYTIVGVAPKGFHGCKSGLRAEVWIPLGMDLDGVGLESHQSARQPVAERFGQAAAGRRCQPGRG